MQDKQNTLEFIQQNSPDGGFLQSAEWQKFQEATGRKTFHLDGEGFLANIIEHALPIVGKYLYCPRGPVFSAAAEKISNDQSPISNKFSNSNDQIRNGIHEFIKLAKKENAGWVRIEPATEKMLQMIKENAGYKIIRAPHDMQPKEIFMLDILKTEQQLLAEMKSKTRYNIGVAKKNEVVIMTSDNEQEKEKYVDAFLELTKEMAARHGITVHPEQYYRKMIESLPEEMLKIYVAQYEGKIIAANLMLFFGKNATYLHGASSNGYRNVMAPFLLQWQAILDAKKNGCSRYDFGGVKTGSNGSSWEGITTFKIGFSPSTKPVEFPGSYDIIINPFKYRLYQILQAIKSKF